MRAEDDARRGPATRSSRSPTRRCSRPGRRWTGWLDEEQAFLADVERIRGAHEIWTQAPDDHKPNALLHGLLLARARDWLLQYPQRFIGRDMEPLRAFIAASAAAEDAEHARGERLRRRFVQAVAAAAIVFAGAAAVSTWQYFEAEKSRKAAVLAEGVAKTAETQARTAEAAALTAEVQARAAEAQAKAAEAQAIEERDRAQRNFGIAKQAADDVVFKLALDLRNVQGMRVEWIRRILDTAQALMDKLAAAAPDDLQLQRSRHAMFADVRGRLSDGRGHRPGARRLRPEPRDHAPADRRRAKQHQLAARARTEPHQSGQCARGERRPRRRARGLRGEPWGSCAGSPPAIRGNVRWQRDLSSSLNNVGDVRRAAGDRAGALKAYEESLAVTRRLVAADPVDSDNQRSLATSLTNVGFIRVTSGDRTGALAAYEEALAIRRKLVAANPRNASMLRDVSISLNNVGFTRLAAGNRAGALAAYEEAWRSGAGSPPPTRATPPGSAT